MTPRHFARLRRTTPDLERLEGRQLLNARIITPSGREINNQDLAHFQLQKANNVALSDRRISYTTPQGSKVQLTLFGFGSLAGTTVQPNGALDLVYDNTTNTSKIVGHVVGGTGKAPIASFRDADVAPRSPSATGSDPINVVNLKKFQLVRGGYVNIEGGVGTLAFASAGPDTQIHIGLLTAAATTSTSSGVLTVPVNNTATSTNGASSTTSTSGQLVTVTPNANRTTTTPTGPEVSIPVVDAAPRAVPIGNAQIFGYDATAGTLVRFDAVTGAALQTVAVPTGGTPVAGVGLGRNNGRQVALVGVGATVYAYDAVTGNPEGQFALGSLAAEGLAQVDGIGSSDTRTFVSDASAGLIQGIDVTRSLATGQAVPSGTPFAPQREFELSGGLTGLAGSDVLYASGAAHFDTFVPDRVQQGILAFAPTTTSARESGRVAVPGLTTATIDAGTPGATSANPTAAVGSVGGSLAIASGLFNGKNVVTLYTPTSTALTATGTVNLADPNRLAGLSESFHPELLGGALLDVTNNLRRFVGQKATGLVINSSGAINLIQIKQATDTAVVGRPLNHVNIPNRRNVALISSARGSTGTDKTGGVTINAAGRPLGVLTLP